MSTKSPFWKPPRGLKHAVHFTSFCCPAIPLNNDFIINSQGVWLQDWPNQAGPAPRHTPNLQKTCTPSATAALTLKGRHSQAT